MSPFPKRIALFILTLFFTSVTAPALEEVSVTDAPVDDHHIQLNMMTGYVQNYGTFDPYGSYKAYPDGSSVWSVMDVLDVDYRLSKVLEFGVSIAMRDSQSIFGDGSSTSSSINGPSLEARYYAPWMSWAHLIFHAGVTLPYKMGPRHGSGDISQYLPSDMSDPSAIGYSYRAGVGLSKNLRPLPFRVAVDVTGTLPVAQDVPEYYELGDASPTVSAIAGKRLGFREGIAYLISQKWSINGGLTQTWASDTVWNGLDQPTTAARLFSSSLGVSYSPHHDWRGTVSYGTPFPFYSAAVNQAYASNMSLALSYGGL